MNQAAVAQPAIDQASDKTAIHPFHVNVPETELTELRKRIEATWWPERETVADATQGSRKHDFHEPLHRRSVSGQRGSYLHVPAPARRDFQTHPIRSH